MERSVHSSGEEFLLPLFPLGVVLFPGSSLPLHIFEDRYKVLIAESLDTGSLFGINMVNEGKVATIGCTARVSTVLKRYEDGRMDVVVAGKDRFALGSLDEKGRPYIVGRASLFITHDEKVDAGLASETIQLYNELIEKAFESRMPFQQINPEDLEISFVLAQKAGLSLLQRQQILETPKENDRLLLLRDHLRDLLPKLEQARDLSRVVQNDGYL